MKSKKFRTVEISDPKFESNNLRYVTVKSKSLNRRGDISLFVPEGIHKNLPIVLLLHGVYGSHWECSQRTGIHLKMQSWINKEEIKPMIIAMPSDGLWGDGSGYLPMENANFEKWIVEDVVDVTIECLAQASEYSKLFIAGLSMGGFGALRLGAKYSERFSGFSGLSSITVLEEMDAIVEEKIESYAQEEVENESVFNTILKNKDSLSKFRFDCGIDDDFIEGNRTLHHQLKKHNIPHVYKEHPGGHGWAYWERHLKETIVFFNQILDE